MIAFLTRSVNYLILSKSRTQLDDGYEFFHQNVVTTASRSSRANDESRSGSRTRSLKSSNLKLSIMYKDSS